MLSTLVLAGFLFHRHHSKPAAPAKSDTTADHYSAIHDKTTDYVVESARLVANTLKDHPELADSADQVYEDLAQLGVDDPVNTGSFNAEKYLKDLDKAQDDLQLLTGKAWALDHFIYT